MAALLGSVAAGTSVLFGGSLAVLGILALVAVTAAVAISTLAVYRFELFVLVLLLARPSLDRLPLDVSGYLALLFLAASLLWLFRRARRHRLALGAVSVAAVAFAGLAVVSVLVSASPVGSAVAGTKTVAGLMMLVVLEQMLRSNPRRGRQVVVAVLGSAIVPCLTAYSQLATGWGLITTSEGALDRVTGTFVHPNPFATYLVFVLVLGVAVLPHLARGTEYVVVAVVLALTSSCLLLTYSRGAWLAALVGLAYLLGRRSKAALLVVTAGLGLVASSLGPVRERFADLTAPPPVEGVPANSLVWRLDYWQDVLPLVGDHLLTGIGLEQVQALTPSGLPPHNAFVQTVVEMGLLGLVSLAVLIFAMGWTLHHRLKGADGEAERALAAAAVAVALGVLLQTVTENLLTQTMALWYLAASATWGLSGPGFSAGRLRLFGEQKTSSASGPAPGGRPA